MVISNEPLLFDEKVILFHFWAVMVKLPFHVFFVLFTVAVSEYAIVVVGSVDSVDSVDSV